MSVPFGRVNPHFDAVARRIRIGAQCFHRLFLVSFRPDLGGPNDPGPLLHLDLQLRGELLGAIAYGLKADRRQPFLRIRLVDDFNDFLMEPRGYVFWRAGRNQNADPGVAIEFRIAGFGDGGQIRKRLRPMSAHHRQCTQLARLDERQRRRQGREADRRVASHH